MPLLKPHSPHLRARGKNAYELPLSREMPIHGPRPHAFEVRTERHYLEIPTKSGPVRDFTVEAITLQLAETLRAQMRLEHN